MDYKKALNGRARAEYGDSYDAHLVEIYNVYREMTDRISSRRQSANSYFLTVLSSWRILPPSWGWRTLRQRHLGVKSPLKPST